MVKVVDSGEGEKQFKNTPINNLNTGKKLSGGVKKRGVS